MAKKIQTLNIGAAQIELAEFELGAKGALTLLNYGIAPLAAPLESGNANTVLAPALASIVREKGIKPGKVAISISGQMVFPKFAAIPMAGGAEKFEQSIRFEIEQSIPFPIDEMICDRQVLGDTESGDKSVMIVAAKTEQIEEVCAAVTSAGFTTDLVDVAPLAVTNVLNHQHADGEHCSVILDIGARTTSLVIVEGDKLYNRSIPIAGNQLNKEIATALGCSLEEAEQAKIDKGYVSVGGVTEDEDEVADRISKVCRTVMTRINAEISRSINFYRSQQHGSAPEALYLTGGTAMLPQTAEFFAESLGIEVVYLNPFEAIATGAKVDSAALENGDMAMLTANAGVAIHCANLAKFSVNLLPPTIVSAKTEKAKIPFVAAGGVTLVVGILLVMLGINAETAVIAAKRDAVASKVSALESQDKRVTKAQQDCDAAIASADELKAMIASRSTAVQRVNAVRAALAKGMWIERWEGGRITVRGWKDAMKGEKGKTAGELVVEKLKGRVAIIEPDSVKIADMSSIGKEAQVEQFTVEMKFK